MIESLLTYWYLSLLLVVILIAAVFMWRKALRSSAQNRRERERLLAAMKAENETRQWFLQLHEAGLAEADDRRLFAGAALSLQAALEKQADLTAAFAALTQEQRNIYALHYLLEDAAEALSHFFRQNGKPLTCTAQIAVREVLGEDAAALFSPMYDAWDDGNEAVSLLPDLQAQQDEAFALYLSEQDPIPCIARYIRQNFAALRTDIH